MNTVKPTLWVVSPGQSNDREALFPPPVLLREVNLLGSLAIFFFFLFFLCIYIHAA